MSSIPVSDLTYTEAVAELERLADERPPEDRVLDRIHWDEKNLARYSELQARLAQPITIPDPTPQETPMQQDQPSHQQTLEQKIAKFHQVHADLVEKPGSYSLRGTLNLLRHQIGAYAEKHGLPKPELPQAPAKPGAALREDRSTPPAKREEEPSAINHIISLVQFTPIENISHIRTQIWLLMADLERLSKDERAALIDELGFLDAAAHSAFGLASGTLQVMA